MESLTATSPCPNCIVVHAGEGFAIGAVGGSFYHFAKGLRNAPSGARFAGGLQAVRMNVLPVAGSFAVFGGVYSACDCALVYVRKKEDIWNPIIAGAAASGILSLRQGFRAVVRSSVHGAIFFALIGGAGILSQRALSQRAHVADGQPDAQPVAISMPADVQPVAMSMPADVPAVTPMKTSSGGGWFGGLFAKKVEGVTDSSSKTDTLEN